VVIAATNHPQLLDAAIWRRFPYKVELGAPNEEVRCDLWRHFLFEDGTATSLPPILAQIASGLSGADIQMIALAARRQAVIESQPLDIPAVVGAVLKAAAGRLAVPAHVHHLPGERKKALALVLVREKGISQSDVARLLGVTRQSVSSYLKGDDDAAA
jgi:SpoVK/Ycf46/Vps4 family AAA+-type ATPase